MHKAIFLLFCLLPALCGRCDPFFLLIGLQQARMLGEAQQMSTCNQGGTIRQSSEYTCGPAALATLLSYYLGEPATELEIAKISDTLKAGTTTLLGLRNAARLKGHEAIGYQMTLPQLLEQLDSSQIPVLVHFQQPELHYVLVTGHLGEDYLLVADPALGDVVMQEADFLRRWSNKALVVHAERMPPPPPAPMSSWLPDIPRHTAQTVTPRRSVDPAVITRRQRSIAVRVHSLEKTGEELGRLREREGSLIGLVGDNYFVTFRQTLTSTCG